MRKYLPFAVLLITVLSLSACESLDKGYSGVKTAFSNFHPFGGGAEKTDIAPASKVAPGDMALASSGSASCPDVRIVPDISQLHQFTDPAQPTPEGTISSVRMTGVNSLCEVVKNNIAVDMNVAFAGDTGPKARAKAGDRPSFAYPYFVAITDDQGNIVAKEIFAVSMAYDSGKDHLEQREQVRQMIPVAEKDKAYKILIGFQLNDEELAYNRSLPPEAPAIEPAAGDSSKTPVIVAPDIPKD